MHLLLRMLLQRALGAFYLDCAATQDYGFAVAYLDHLFRPPKDCSGLKIRHHHKWLSSDRFFTQTDPYHRTGELRTL